MGIVPLEKSPGAARDFVAQHRLQVGHVLPLTEKIFNEYFPAERSFLFHRGKRVSGIFSYRPGRDKLAPTAGFRAVADPRATLRQLVEEVEKTAVAGEKISDRWIEVNADETISYFARRQSSITWDLPEPVHSGIIEKIRGSLGGKTLRQRAIDELAVWDSGQLRNLSESFAHC